MADISAMQRMVDRLEVTKVRISKDLSLKREEVSNLVDDLQDVQEKIDKIQGTENESDGAITTTTAGDISVPGGRGNFSPKIGGTRNRTGNVTPAKLRKEIPNKNRVDVYGKPSKKAKVYENAAWAYISESLDIDLA
jgi:Asp-tRNA(Asn)/Glu-tRNA(Gln) amidotransferase C subunit